MNDLTDGSIPRHIARLAVPIAIGLVFQTLYYLVDLYFVGLLGDAAVAGLSTAGNIQFLNMALAQVLGVGTMALIAQAVGRKDRTDANRVYNQGLSLAAGCAAATLVIGYGGASLYMGSLAADTQSQAAGTTYLYWFLPGMALHFAIIAMSGALRALGIIRPVMLIQVLTVLVNALLSPILVIGWLTGVPLGMVGAGLSTTLSIVLGFVLMHRYFVRHCRYLRLDRRLVRPHWPSWRRIFAIGVPPGGEFALLFVYMAVIYWTIRDFGAEAQAGFGIGMRVMQAVFLPAMAIAFAASPVAGQNVGAGQGARVRQTFHSALVTLTVLMTLLTLLCNLWPEPLIAAFSRDPAVIAVGAEYLQMISWNFVATGVVFTCSGIFQALGNTMPALTASASRLVTFVLPALWLSTQSWFELRHLWTLSVVTVLLQAALSWWWLTQRLRARFAPVPA